jgi:hypothetical protein
VSLWQKLKGIAGGKADQLTCTWIADAGPVEPLRANRDYVRVWLSDLFLARGRRWFTDHFPAVHATVVLERAGWERTELTTLVRPPADQLAPGVSLNHPLTPLLPYRGGVVRVQGGLLVVEGDDVLAAALDVVQELSALVAPGIGSALGVAERVAGGVKRLVGAGGQAVLRGDVGFGGDGHELRRGYIAVVRAPAGSFGPDELGVDGGRLSAAGRPLEGHDYMLFRIEARDDRDDWRFPEIEDLLGRARTALAHRDTMAFEAFRNAAMEVAARSPELSDPDRRRVPLAIKAALEQELGAGAGAESAAAAAGLDALVATHGISVDAAALAPDLTLEQMLAER